jgi:hypothetical protein
MSACGGEPGPAPSRLSCRANIPLAGSRTAHGIIEDGEMGVSKAPIRKSLYPGNQTSIKLRCDFADPEAFSIFHL